MDKSRNKYLAISLLSLFLFPSFLYLAYYFFDQYPGSALLFTGFVFFSFAAICSCLTFVVSLLIFIFE